MQTLLYVALGIISDLFVTGYYICVGKGWAFPAATISIPIALLNFWVFGSILVINPSWYNALAYAVGNAVGCYGIMALSKKVKR
jgi:hypothetical protein